MKARIKLQDWNGTVVMQVLDMDESLINKTNKSFFNGSKYKILSTYHPSIDEGLIYLRGIDKEHNYRIISSSEDKYSDVLTTFQEWGKHLAKEQTQEVDDGVLYKWAYKERCERIQHIHCANCVFSINGKGCEIKELTKEQLLKAYNKAHQLETTFKWIDESQGIFEV